MVLGSFDGFFALPLVCLVGGGVVGICSLLGLGWSALVGGLFCWALLESLILAQDERWRRA